METLQEQLLVPQLDIGKVVLESMIEIYLRDGAMKGVVIPATFQDKEFEIEVRMKWYQNLEYMIKLNAWW